MDHSLIEVKLPCEHICPSICQLVGWLVSQLVCLSVKISKFHFHAPTLQSITQTMIQLQVRIEIDENPFFSIQSHSLDYYVRLHSITQMMI